jgi:hypothetical protein
LLVLILAAPFPQASRPVGDGFMRILPHAVHAPMAINADGAALSPMSPDSSLPTTLVVHRAGVHKTRRFSFLSQFDFNGKASGTMRVSQ